MPPASVRTTSRWENRKRPDFATPKLCFFPPPMQTAGNHQMEDDPEFVFKSNCDAFANSPQFTHYSALSVRKGRFHGATERSGKANPFKRLRLFVVREHDIGSDIGSSGIVMSDRPGHGQHTQSHFSSRQTFPCWST